jgi:endonuclease/exonuclease/phosphatase family metal-dependent hydrolase
LFLGSATSQAEGFRATSWNLNYLPSSSRDVVDQRIRDAAIVLSATDSDVFLLQELPDMVAAQRLATLLVRGPFRLLACSQFAESEGQVAVLSRLEAIQAGTEPWRSNDSAAARSGFAFATVRIGAAQVVVYSVRLPENPVGATADSDFKAAIQLREAASRQTLDHLNALQTRVDPSRIPVVLGGDFNTSRDQSPFAGELTIPLLEQAGLSNTYGALPLRSRITRPASGRKPDATFDYILARGAVASTPRINMTRASDHLPVTVDVVLAQSPTITQATTSGERGPTPAPGSSTAGTSRRVRLWPALIAGLAVAVFVVWRFQPWRRAQRNLSRPGSSGTAGPSLSALARTVSPDQIAVAGTDTASSTAAYWQKRALSAERKAQTAIASAQPGMAPHVAGLMKDEVVSHLLDQRAEAAQAQESGAAALSGLEGKLASIQAHTALRVQLYEKRIAQLEAQLLAKEEINRQLLVAEIEGAREALQWVKLYNGAEADLRRLDEVDSKIRQAEESMLEAVREAQEKIRNEPSVRFSSLMARRMVQEPREGQDERP